MHDLLTAWVPYFAALGWGVWTLVDELWVRRRRERLRRERERGNLTP